MDILAFFVFLARSVLGAPPAQPLRAAAQILLVVDAGPKKNRRPHQAAVCFIYELVLLDQVVAAGVGGA
jgi:hypothetical protein